MTGFAVPLNLILNATAGTIWVWLLASSLSSFWQATSSATASKYSPANFTSFYETNTTMYHIVDQGYTYTWETIFFLILVIAMVFVYYVVFYATDGSKVSEGVNRKRISAGNIIFTMVIFTVFVALYDDTQTYKPWWTELLG